MKHFPKGLDGRERDENGRIRKKNGNTLLRTLRQEYGPDFAEGHRSDMKLKTLRAQTGKSLSEMLNGK